MEAQRTLMLPEDAVEQISEHARETFPEECCGVIVTDGIIDRVHRLANIQNRLHALDPETYPRTAVIAYAMDPRELEQVLEQAKLEGNKLKAFYHSHPDHDAYFSEEDRAFATPFGEPTFPGAAQLVISIYHRVVKQICVYVWSETNRNFVEVPLQTIKRG